MLKRPSRDVAREILKIIPLVMRTVAAELRGLGTLKALDYEGRRAGGGADVVVIGGASRGGARKGLTEDYLTVTVAECDVPRGSRIVALLELCDGALFARPLES